MKVMNEMKIMDGKKIQRSSFKYTDNNGNVVRYAETECIREKKNDEGAMIKLNHYIKNCLENGGIQYETERASYYGIRNIFESDIASLEKVPDEWRRTVVSNLKWLRECTVDPEYTHEEIDKELKKFWDDRNSSDRFLPAPKDKSKSLIDKTFRITTARGIVVRYTSQFYMIDGNWDYDISPAHNSLFLLMLKKELKQGLIKVEEEADFYGFVNIPEDLFLILEKQTAETIVEIRDECRKIAYREHTWPNWTTLFQAIKNIVGVDDKEMEDFYTNDELKDLAASFMVGKKSILPNNGRYY